MDWKVLLEQAPSGGMTYLGWLASGLFWTLAVSACAWVIAFAVGSVVGVARTVPLAAARLAATAYVELFRNIPLLVQMFLWYFVMPEVIPKDWGDWLKQDMPNLLTLPFAAQFSLWEFTAAVLCLGLYTASRVAEQVRSGIQSLPRGQTSAGLAMGLTLPQVYRYVLLPMAFRIVIPPLTSESMNIVKNSSVAFAVSIAELTFFAMQAQEETARGIEIYLAVTFLYFVSAFAVNRVAAAIEKRVRVPGMIGGAK